MEVLLAEAQPAKDGDEAGPETELEEWRRRMAQFNSITEQLKGKPCRLVLGVATAAQSAGFKRWKALDLRVRGLLHLGWGGRGAVACACSHDARSWRVPSGSQRGAPPSLQVTDATNEAKDNAKYLATLARSFEPMWVACVGHGGPCLHCRFCQLHAAAGRAAMSMLARPKQGCWFASHIFCVLHVQVWRHTAGHDGGTQGADGQHPHAAKDCALLRHA